MSPTDDIPPTDDGDVDLAARGEMLVAVAVADTRAPLALRERIEADRARLAPAARRRRASFGLSFAAAAAAVLLAVTLVVPSGTPGGPTVVEAASLGLNAPEEGAPAPDPATPALLQAAQDGVAFPAWVEKFGWQTKGLRTDEVDGRDATTVYYETPKGVLVTYTIVGGDALDVPSGRMSTVAGTRLTVVRDGDRQVVTWEREGHTCVMSAPASFDTAKLLELAAWKGKGSVPF